MIATMSRRSARSPRGIGRRPSLGSSCAVDGPFDGDEAAGEVDARIEVSARIRPLGAGRPKAVDARLGLLVALDDLVGA
jgi:hypothetical protein